MVAKHETRYCSFCGKSEYEVSILIAEPIVFICGECVDLCASIRDDVDKARAIKAEESLNAKMEAINNVLAEEAVSSQLSQTVVDPQPLQQVITELTNELVSLRLEVKKYAPMFAEWKRNKDRRNGVNISYGEYER